jgi:hypothetical protein
VTTSLRDTFSLAAAGICALLTLSSWNRWCSLRRRIGRQAIPRRQLGPDKIDFAGLRAWLRTDDEIHLPKKMSLITDASRSESPI